MKITNLDIQIFNALPDGEFGAKDACDALKTTRVVEQNGCQAVKYRLSRLVSLGFLSVCLEPNKMAWQKKDVDRVCSKCQHPMNEGDMAEDVSGHLRCPECGSATFRYFSWIREQS